MRGGVQEYALKKTPEDILVQRMLTAHFEKHHFIRCDSKCAHSSISEQILTVQDEPMVVSGLW